VVFFVSRRPRVFSVRWRTPDPTIFFLFSSMPMGVEPGHTSGGTLRIQSPQGSVRSLHLPMPRPKSTSFALVQRVRSENSPEAIHHRYRLIYSVTAATAKTGANPFPYDSFSGRSRNGDFWSFTSTSGGTPVSPSADVRERTLNPASPTQAAARPYGSYPLAGHLFFVWLAQRT